MFDLLKDLVLTVLSYLKADWLILLIGITLAVAVNVYIDSNKLESYLKRNSKLSIAGSIAFGAFTPLCACGTMAVLLSMFISSLPWGPVMAFLVSSPLTSPSEFMFESAFLGTRFAIAVLISSLVLGLAAGYLAHFLDVRTSFFKGQFRLKKSKSEAASENEVSAAKESCCSSKSAAANGNSFIQRFKLDKVAREFYNLGIKKILLFFIIFIAVGRIVEIVIPKEWILSLFSSDNGYSIPLGAMIGLPLYVSGSAALPIMKSFMNSGASEAVLLAFLITGKATGIPVIAGMSTILKKRAIIFYVAFVLIGGILSGYAYQLYLSLIH